jgi:hypothetical protein
MKGADMFGRTGFEGRRGGVPGWALGALVLAVASSSILLASCGGGSATSSSLSAATTVVTAQNPSTSLTTTTLAPTTTSSVVETTTTEAVTTTLAPTTTTTEAPTTTTTVALKWTRYQDTNSHLAYSGTHIKVSSVNASGGTYTEVRKGAKVTIKFTGTRVRVAAIKKWTGGIVVLSLDGSSAKVDLYADVDFPDYVSEIVWTSKVLAYGPHTLVISNTGLMNPISDGAIDCIDAVDIKGTMGI